MHEKLKKNFPLIIICFFGAFLRFYKLSYLVFHLDEPLHTVQMVANSLSFVLTHDFGSIVYQLLVHFLLPLGKLELMSRLPAVLFGILIILGTYYVGKLFFGKKIGLIAALFVSFSHYLLSHSQYARAYTTLTFFSLLSLFMFYKAIKENETKYWILYIIITALNIYTHLMTLVTVISFTAFVGILFLDKKIKLSKKKSWQIDKSRLIRFIFCTLAIIVITILLQLPVGQWGGETSSLDWMGEQIARIMGESTIGFFPLISRILAYQMFRIPSFSYFVALVFMIFGIISCLIRLRREDVFLLLYIFVPLLCFYLIKPRAHFFLAADRYFIFLLPLIFILLVKGMHFLSLLFISLGSHSGVIKKRGNFYRNLILAFIVACFFLLECFALKEYANYNWKLRSLKVDKTVQDLLKDRGEDSEVIFVDYFPDSSSVLFLTPIELQNEEKRAMIYKNDIQYLDTISNQSGGLWLVMDRSLLKQETTLNFHYDLVDADITNVGRHSIIHWEPGNRTLSNKLIQMVEFLLPLHSDKEEEYRLLLANFHLLNLNLKEAIEELEILEEKNLLSVKIKKEESQRRLYPRIVNFLTGNNQNSQMIVLTSLQRNMERQLWNLGNKLLSEENLADGLAAIEKCAQMSDEFHVSISREYFSLGNRFFRTERVDQAIIFLNKAIELNPENYFYHLVLAEAYWSKNKREEAIYEYKTGFSASSVSDEFILQLISKPRLFAIWKDTATWHFLWRSDENSEFTGNLYFGKKIDRMQKHHFSKRDRVNQYKDYAVEFSFSAMERRIKTLEIEAGRKSKLTCYIKVNGQIKTDEIVFINTSENPEEIPFSLSADGILRTNKK